MKVIKVVAAVLYNDGKVLATQRASGELKGGWEFPGGKVEPGETREAAIVREIREELAVEIVPVKNFFTVEHDYEKFHLSMACFWSHIVDNAQPVLLEHSAAKWVGFEELDSLAWCPADRKVVSALKAAWPELVP